jgi:hypothetical protein
VILFSFGNLGRGADLHNRLTKLAPGALRPRGLPARATRLQASLAQNQGTSGRPMSSAGAFAFAVTLSVAKGLSRFGSWRLARAQSKQIIVPLNRIAYGDSTAKTLGSVGVAFQVLTKLV